MTNYIMENTEKKKYIYCIDNCLINFQAGLKAVWRYQNGN